MWARGESLLGRGTLRPERVEECTTSCICCSDVAHDRVVVHCLRIRCDVVHGCVVAVCLLGYCSHVCFGGEIAYGRALCGRSCVLTLLASVGACRSALLVRHFIYQCPEHTFEIGSVPMLRGGVGRRGGWQITARMHGDTMQVLGRFIAARAGAAWAFVAGHGVACPCMLFPKVQLAQLGYVVF